MIINGTLKKIRVERTRSLVVGPTELSCPDYRLEGNFAPYNRLADFLWQIISTRVIPSALKKNDVSEKQNEFLESDLMLPASLTILSKNKAGMTEYLLVCMNRDLTTTYRVYFSMDQEIFRRSQYGFLMTDLLATVTAKGVTREFQMTDVTEQGYNAYWELAQALWLIVEDSVALIFDGTEEEDDAQYYFTPRWIGDLGRVSVHLERNENHCHLTGSLADGSYRAEATFTIHEKLG